MLEAEPEEAVPMLRSGELEIALVEERRPLDQFGELYEGLDLHHLLEEPMYALLLPPEHRLARRKRLQLADLADEVRIELGRSPTTRSGRIYLAPGSDSGDQPRVGFRSDDINVVQGMVAAGAGIAVVPELALANLRADIVVRTLDGSAAPRTIAAASLAGVNRSPATVAMLELLAEVSQRHRTQTQPRRKTHRRSHLQC